MNPAVIRRGVPFALASKTGEEGEVYMHIYIYIYIYIFFLGGGVFFLPLRLSRCPYMGKPLSGVGEQYCYTHWYVA